MSTILLDELDQSTRYYLAHVDGRWIACALADGEPEPKLAAEFPIVGRDVDEHHQAVTERAAEPFVPAILDRATAAVEVSLHFKPRYGMTEAKRQTAARLLAVVWAAFAQHGVRREDLILAGVDTPAIALNVANVLARRAEIAAKIQKGGQQ